MKKIMPCLLFICISSLAQVVLAASDYFLKIDGVNGESKAQAMRGEVRGGVLYLVGEDGRQMLAPDGVYQRKSDGARVTMKGQRLLLPAVQKLKAPAGQNPQGVVAPIDSNPAQSHRQQPAGVIAPIDSNAVQKGRQNPAGVVAPTEVNANQRAN